MFCPGSHWLRTDSRTGADIALIFNLCLMLAAVAPKLTIALVLLLIRAALSQMDVPTRSSYVMAVVTEPERPAAASFTSVPRTLAAAVSPAMRSRSRPPPKR